MEEVYTSKEGNTSPPQGQRFRGGESLSVHNARHAGTHYNDYIIDTLVRKLAEEHLEEENDLCCTTST